jgi:hypothetical protein
MLPIAIIGVAVLAVLGSGAYLFMGKGESGDAKTSPALASPATEKKSDSPAPLVTPPVAAQPDPAPTPTILPASPADSPTVLPAPVDQPAKVDLPPGVAVGKVDLRIKPWGTISVNGGAKVASPPTMQLQLPPGSYTIEIQNPAGPAVTKSVEVVAGKSTTVRHSF